MKPFVLSSVTAAFFTAALAVTPAPGESARKCLPSPVIAAADGPELPDWLFIRDGEVVAEEEVNADPESVETVEVICAEDLRRIFGLEARRGAVVVFTGPGPHAALRENLDAITSLQDAYLAEHGVFASELDALPWSDPSGRIEIDLVVTDGGSRWSATARHQYLLKDTFVASASGEADERTL